VTHDATMDLGERFAHGDESALREVVRLYSGPMFTTALHILGDRDLAADAVQDAFVRAWRAASTFDAGRDLKPWLYTITRRAAVDVHRRRRGAHDIGLDDLAAPPAVAGPALENTWEAWEVREALEQLPADEHEVMRLTYFDGATYPEIAETLGVPVGTVKSRAFRAHRRLRDLLGHLTEVAG
jgi:RNA polymerase sigma-70 factor, ECF subfamily